MIKITNKKASGVLCIVALLGTTATSMVQAQPAEPPPLFQALTKPARDSIVAGMAKAQNVNRTDMGTDLLLWALVRDTQGTAARILRDMGVPAQAIRLQLEAQMAWSQAPETEPAKEEVKLSEGAKRVIELAADEARLLPREDKSIQTQHLLLGLLRYRQDLPFSYTVLRNSGVTLEKARESVIKQPHE